MAFYHQQQPIELKRFFQFKGALEFWNQIHWRKTADMDWEQEPSQCDGLFHCAAMVSYHHKDHKKMNEVNVHGTAQWVNWALDFDIPICHVSSIASLGKAESSGWVDEQCYWQPSKDHTEYSRTKFLSEMEIWRGIEEGLSAVIVNPGVIIGACEPHQSSGKLIQTVARGWNVYPSGGTGFVSATDVAKAMLQLMKKKKMGGALCFGGRELDDESVFSNDGHDFWSFRSSKAREQFNTVVVAKIGCDQRIFNRKESGYYSRNHS